MNRDFLYTVIVLLVAMVATVKWHHNTDNSENESKMADTVYICNLLGEKLTAKDNLILQLRETIEMQEAELNIEFENDEVEVEPNGSEETI